jgi:hypothetical protein
MPSPIDVASGGPDAKIAARMKPAQEPPNETLYPQLRYSFTTGTGQRIETDDFLINFKVRIVGIPYPEEGSTLDRELDLGTLEATLIRVERVQEENYPLAYVFDHDATISDLSGALFEGGLDDFVEPIRDAFPDAFPYQDILLIRELALKPFARGQRAGISALHRFITDWESSCALVAIQPRPMQFMPTIREYDDWDTLALDQLSKDRDASIAKLKNHFRGLGFRNIDPLPCMLLCPAYRTAPLAELALENSLVLPAEILEDLA